MTAATCVAIDQTATSAAVPDEPVSGELFHYLVRAENDCDAGAGPLGNGSDGTPRSAIACR